MNTKTCMTTGALLAALLLAGCVTYTDPAYEQALSEWQECKWKEEAGSPVYCGMEPEPRRYEYW